ncbi:hypothetical protein [Lusitaniella coriacea]|uniref:hypothetical protein n=1 Tax=Lusitaniella coriacea TaxID=1983105 RepID=UPI003CF0AD66
MILSPTTCFSRLQVKEWIIDPQERIILVLCLDSVSGQYIEMVFRDRDRAISPTFPTLELTPKQIFDAIDPLE